MKYTIKEIGKKALVGAIIARGLVSLVGDVSPNRDVPNFNDLYIADVYGSSKPEVVVEGSRGNTYIYTQDQMNGNYVLAKDKIGENYQKEIDKIRLQSQEQEKRILSESYNEENKAGNVGFGKFDEVARRNVEIVKAHRNLDLAELGNKQDIAIMAVNSEKDSEVRALERRVDIYHLKK